MQPYGDEHGIWISSFAPIKNSQNETVAIVQADIKFNEFIDNAKEKAKNELITSTIIVLIALISIVFILNFMLTRINKQQKFLLKEFKQLDELSNHIKSFLKKHHKRKF